MTATYYPLPEAAARLGVSQSALRRRLRAGTAQGERRPSAGGFTWWVACDDPTPTPGEPAPTPQADLVAAQEAVRRLEAHCASLTEELAARRREAERLHTLLAQAHQLALPAPAPNGQAAGAPVPAGTPSAPPAGEPTGRSWWQRLGGWLSGAPPQPAGG